MKRRGRMTIVLISCFAVMALAVAHGGSLDPTAPPDDAASDMVSLNELHAYLTEGTLPGPMAGFQEPSSGPDDGTMVTVQEIYDAIAGALPGTQILSSAMDDDTLSLIGDSTQIVIYR